MKLFALSFLFLLVAFFSCTNSFSDISSEKQEIKFPVFVDTMTFTEEHKVLAEYEGSHYPIYFGNLTDTVTVFHNVAPPFELRYTGWELDHRPSANEYDDYFHYTIYEGEMQSWDSVQLGLHIDLDQTIQNYGRDAYPVLVQNTTNDTVQVGYGHYIPLILEGKDGKGNWRPLEDKHIYACGTGMSNILLPSKEYVATSVVKTSGNFKTQLRLRLGECYSREYVGSIDSLNFVPDWR